MATFPQRAVAWFGARGVTVERIMTDNGSGYVSRHFARRLEGLGIRHIRTRPYRPQTNGKAERFIQTAIREWAYVRAYTTSEHRTAALTHFQKHYNGTTQRSEISRHSVGSLSFYEQRPWYLHLGLYLPLRSEPPTLTPLGRVGVRNGLP